MSASLNSPIARAVSGAETSTGAPAAADDSEERERAEDAWAMAIAQTFAEGVRPRLTLPLPPEPEALAAGTVTPAGGADANAATLGEGAAPGTETSAKSPAPGPALPNRLTTELSDSQLGRMQLSVTRGANGLRIVINVADSHVKALIEAEQSQLWKSLQGCGLRIDSVKIGSKLETGTALAQQEAAQERALARGRGNPNLRPGSARWRGYAAPTDEDPDDDAERVDLTA